jgi:hypothetical protein
VARAGAAVSPPEPASPPVVRAVVPSAAAPGSGSRTGPSAGAGVPPVAERGKAGRSRGRLSRFVRFVGRVVLLVGLMLVPVVAALLAYGINDGEPLLDDFQDLVGDIDRLVRRW